MLFDKSLRRASQAFVCTFLNTNMYIYKVSKRSLNLCVLNKFSRRLRLKILKNINCAVVALVTWFRFVSVVVEFILYTFGLDCVSVFCDWYKFP